MIIILFSVMTWYLSGVVSFIYWWTKDYDLDSEILPLMFLAGLTGLVTFLIGWTIHGDHNNKILIKRRDMKDKRGEK